MSDLFQDEIDRLNRTQNLVLSLIAREQKAADALEAAEAKLAAIDALHRRAIFVGLCDYCARGWPCETYRILHHNSAEDGAEP